MWGRGFLAPQRAWARVQEKMHRVSAKPSRCRLPAVPSMHQCPGSRLELLYLNVSSRFNARIGYRGLNGSEGKRT